MESINKCHTLFFDAINFIERLEINVIEGKRAASPEPLTINGTSFGEAYRVTPDWASKSFTIKFEHPVAWQVVNESYDSYDENEIFESTGLFSVITKSKYLDYVNNNHGLYRDIIGNGKLYRIWTESQVVEVVSVDEPTIIEQ